MTDMNPGPGKIFLKRLIKCRGGPTGARITLSTANMYAMVKLDGPNADVMKRSVMGVAGIIR